MRNWSGVAPLSSLLILSPLAAQAYIGPGLGTGVVASVLGVLGSIVLVMIAVVYYPIKRMLKRRRPRTGQADPSRK